MSGKTARTPPATKENQHKQQISQIQEDEEPQQINVKQKSINKGSIKYDQNNESLRMNKLETVFAKALDMSMNNIGESNLDDCFGDLKSQYGNTMQKSFVNMIGVTQHSMQESFRDICIQRDMDEKLKILENTDRLKVSNDEMNIDINNDYTNTDDPLESVLIELKSIELFNLKKNIEEMEHNIKELTDKVEKKKLNMKSEISSVSEELKQISLASNQCLST
jgi:hypothetical protein